MSDFLASLVNRALGREAVLQPRRPSLYEPAPERGFDVAPAETGGRDVEFRNASHVERSTDPQRSPRPAAPASVGEMPSPHAMPAVDARPATPTRPQAPEGLRTIVVDRTELDLPHDREEAARGPEPRALTHADAHPALPVHVEVRPSGEEGARADAVRSHRPETATHEVGVRPSPVPARAAFSSPRPTERRDSRPAAAEPARPDPVVHVTIGRVEIKATSAPSSPERGGRSKGPRLSLEDYLRSRGGGAR